MKKHLLKTLLTALVLLVGGVGSAWAETLIFTEDFSHETYNVNWGGTSAGGISPEIIDGMLRVANGSSNGDRSAYIAFGSNAYTGCSRLTFDMAMTKSGWSGKKNDFYVLPSATTSRYPSTTDAVLIISQDSEGVITVAGESLGKYDGVVLTYDLFLNTVTGFAKIVVKNGETEIKSFSYSTTAKGINTLHLTFNKNFGAFAIDNISLYSIIAPKFSLTSTEKVISVGGTERVDVSDIIGVVSVSSDNESVASSSYEDGVVTINGVSSGVANITVTATNDGLETSLTIVATVGEVAKTDVTITYLDENDIPIATSLIIEDVAVGSLLTSSEIIYEPVLYGTGVRYVNPVLEQSLPYTVVEDGVINIKYTKQAAVTSIQKIVKVADKELSRENILLEDKYVGDALSLSYPLYINDNGTLYAKNAISSSYCQSFTLTETSQECVLSYALSEITNVTYFSEAETIDGAIATSKGNNMLTRSSNQACAYAGNDIVMTNLPAGVYKATMVFYSNSSAGITLPFDFGGTEYNATASAANNWATATTDFTLYLASDIIWKKSGDSKNGLDFVYIQKIRDVSEAEIALANAKKKLGLAIEQAEGLYNAEKTGAEDLNTAMADASELLYGEQAGEATTETLTAALVSLTQAIGTYVYANMSDEMKQAVTLVADNDALTAANVANIVATAETTNPDELAGLIIAAITNDANGVEDLAAAIATAITTDDESGLANAIAAFNVANAPFDPNMALLNPSFELSGEETASTAQGLSTSGGNYYGWTLPNLNSSMSNISIGNASDCAGNAFGVPTAKDGSFYYFARRGWNSSSSGDAILSTTMTALPVGHYTLTMAYKGLDSWDDSHNSKGSYLKFSVLVGETELGATQTKAFETVKGNSAGANKFTGDANWQEASLEFSVETESDVTLNIVHHLVGGVRSDVVIDNLVLAYKSFEEIAAEELAAAKEALDAEIEKAEGFKTEARTEGLADYESAINDAKSAQELTSLEDVTQAIADLQDAELSFLTANLPVQAGTYYIYNPLTNKFLARGNAYGTAAVVADYGVAINVEAEVSDETPDGNYSLVGFDNNASYGFDEWMYADAGGNNVRTYTIAKSGEGYTITNTNNSKFVYVYLKEDGNKYRVAGNAIKDDNYTDDAQTVWQFIKPDAYNDMIAGRIAAEKTAAFAAAEIAEDADVVLGEHVELTFATGHGWTQTVVRTENNQPKTDDNGTEMWQATGYYTQTVSGLPSGLYKVSIQAFYRNGGPDVCVNRYNTGYNTVLAYLDANGSKIQVKSWATDKGDDSDPNSMAQAKAKFDEGKYLSETYAYVGGDGNLNLTVYNPAHIGSGWFIVNNVKYAAVTLPIDPNALATEGDYTALTDAITAVEEKLGFLSGEYAPYNNIEALQLLAAAKSIDKLSDNLQTDVQNATTALTNAKWNVNNAEVNAIFDGSFEHDYSGQTGDINPIGWQRVKGAAADGYNVRLMNGTNAGLAATTSGKALFTKQSAYYGYADGYTMPLKANTIYKISFVYGGWGDCKKDGYVSMTAPDGSAVDVSPADLPVDATKADSDENSWKPYTALFKTGDAGEYVLGLRKKNYDTSGQSQYVYGDIRIFRATAADFKEQLAAEIAIADDVDVTANVGAAAFQIPASAVTSLSSAISTAQGIYDDADATIDEVLQAVENLKKAEDDYSNAELNAPAANKVYNIVNVTPDYNHAGKAVTFKSSATADLAGNTTSMGWNEEPGSVYPQGVKFTSVEGVKNTYILSYTRADGTDIYVSTGTTSGLGSSTSQIRPTTDAAKALKVRVEASTTDGVWYLWNTEADKRLGANGANDQGFFTGEANGNKYYDMKLQEAVNNEYNLVVDATNQYATLIVPFDATVPADIIAYSLSNANGNELELQPVTEIKANTPYVVYAEDGFTTTLAGLGAAFTENSYTTGWLTGVYAETAVPNGSYVLQNHRGNVAFYVVDTDAAQPKVQANHAYMNIPSGGDARAYYFGGEATAIGALKALTSGDAEIYDVNGRKQAKLQKGVNIIRSKDGQTRKVMVK